MVRIVIISKAVYNTQRMNTIVSAIFYIFAKYINLSRGYKIIYATEDRSKEWPIEQSS